MVKWVAFNPKFIRMSMNDLGFARRHFLKVYAYCSSLLKDFEGGLGDIKLTNSIRKRYLLEETQHIISITVNRSV